MELRICSALQKVFSNAAYLPPENARLHLFTGERGNLQLCLRTKSAAELCITVESALPCRLYLVNEVYVSRPGYDRPLNRCTLLRGDPGYYPDLLTPFAGKLQTEAGKAYALWLETDAADAKKGEYPVRFTVTGGGESGTCTAAVWVNGVKEAPQKLIHTDWFHSDCLSTYYNAPVFGEDYWRIVESFMKNAASHGVNCILTPLFTPALDTEVGKERPTVQLLGVTQTETGWEFDFSLVEKWMALAERCGITYFEFSHLFTQWGALAAPKVIARTPAGEKRVFGWETDSLSPEYRAFLRALGPALTAFTDARGITQRCFVHCSDEPGGDHVERYRKCAALVHGAFGAYRHIDALSDYVYYEEGLVPLPVPSENSIAPFVGKAKPLWTYYCCGQLENEMPNRFIAIPSVKNRILGALLYKYGCEGFLHWGYNFWYSQLSRKAIDPFTDTCSDNAFPGGDAFCVYPGENGEPLPSLRQKVFYDGLQDLAALQTAEEKLGREAVLGLIRSTLGEIDFAHYPFEEERFFAFREALWSAVQDGRPPFAAPK